ncbi:MAG: SPOR domain-containing protein [Bacteroidetes bacterium]|nr:MAG: SPOR domain-containing protein [Bacteroidota bacterium]
MRTTLVLVLAIAWCTSAAGQQATPDPSPRYMPQPEVAALFDKFVRLNKSTPTVRGWRIQLLASTDRSRVERELIRFRTLYPNITADWVHQSPYYKLLAGAFESREEAYQYLYIVRQDYPNAFPARDDSIRPEELLY